jgi:diguanylate cyclase (GGDEF)-like protein/PAS domain S-box-containing protein
LYAVYYILLGLGTLLALATAVIAQQDIQEAQTTTRLQWELYQAHRNLANLQFTTKEFQERGNWLALAAALDRPLTGTLITLAERLRDEKEEATVKAFREFERHAADLESSLTHVLALHFVALELDEQTIPEHLRVPVERVAEMQTSQTLLLAKAQEILESRDLYLKFVQASSLLDSLADLALTDWLSMSAKREHALRAILGVIGILLIAGLILPWYVRTLVRQRAEFNKAIVELGERLAGITTTRDAAGVLLNAADRLMGWDAAGVSLYDVESGLTRDVLWIDTIEGVRVDVTDPIKGLPASPLQHRVLNGEKLLLFGPLDRDLAQYTFGDTSRPSQSRMFVPVYCQDRVVGYVTIQSYKPHAYSERDLELPAWLAQRFGAALERAQLYERVQKSEELYRKLVDTSLDGVFIVDLEEILFVNKAFARMFGYDSPEEIVGKVKPFELLRPDEQSRFKERFVRRAEGEVRDEPFLWHGQRKDGREIIVESLGTPTFYEGRRVVLGTCRDVTERERARERLEAIHRIYRRAIEAVGGVPYRLDLMTKQFEFPTEAIEELTGFKAEELTYDLFQSRIVETVVIYPTTDAERVKELEKLEADLPAEEAQRHQRLLRLLTGDAKLWRAELLFERKDGRRVWLLDSAVFEEDNSGRPRSALGILLDITEQKRAQQRAEVFARLTATLGTARTAQKGARIVIEHARELFDFDSCFVSLYDETTGLFVPIYAEDTTEEGQRIEAVPQREPSPLGKRLLQGESVFILRESSENIGEELAPFGATSRRSLSIMMVPLRHGERIIGAMGVHSYRPHAFTAKDLEDLQAMASHCAATMEYVVLHERLAESEEQLRALWMNAPIGIRLTDAEGIIWFVNPAYCQLVGLTEEQLIGQPLSIVYAPHEREHVLRRYRERFERGTIEEQMQREIELWDGSTRIFQVTTKFLKTSSGRMLLSIVLDRTEEIRLVRELEEKKKELELLATHDPLTGLMNRRLVLELMHHELERARRYRLPVCVLMIDLDHFKQVNDTYGHLAGDDVLQQFAIILSKNTRAVDIVGRYGGEEFVVVMPETGLEGALVFAERLRTAVERHEFVTRSGHKLHITCSIGVTQGEPELLDIDHLLALADKALYRAKEEGRNRVRVA